MSTKLTADEIVQMQHIRGFIQFGEAGPENDLEYYGKSGQYFFVESVSDPETGSISPVNMPDPMRRKKWRLVGREYSPPDLPSYSLILYEKHGRVPRALGRIGCEFNLFLTVGRCKDPSDFDRGWQDYLHVLEGGVVSDKDHGTRMSMTDDTPVTSTVTVTLADEYAIGPLGFGPQASVLVTTEVIDGTYGIPDACEGCQDGIGRQYVVQKAFAGSPAAAAKVFYKTEDLDWTALPISGIGIAATPVAIRVVGSYLLVLVKSEGAYYYSEINDLTGIPSSSWTKVATGFDAGGPPNDILIASPTEIFIVGDAGFIYRSTSIPAGVSIVDAGSATSENLLRIKGNEEVIVATGANGAAIKSIDAGLTFASITTPSTVLVQALEVVTALRFWIGDSTGHVWWTKNGGLSWHAVILGTQIVAIQDISFATRASGFILGTSSSPQSYVFATQNGGVTWVNGIARLPNLATIVNDRYDRIAQPFSDSSQANVNNVMLVGLAGNGTDGVILTAHAAEL